MVKFVNLGLYNVNLLGEKDYEFDGDHPTLVIQSKKEKEVYIAIPFTTYTKERWDKLKKRMCCRVKSTNSIARIDKMEVINVSLMRNRWKFSDNKLLIPSKEDLDIVLKKAIIYFQASINEALSDYVELHQEMKIILDELQEVIIDGCIDNSRYLLVNFDDNNNLLISFDLSLVSKCSVHEIYDLVNTMFDRNNSKIYINNKTRKIEITIDKNDAKVLTLKMKYDKLNVSEG